MLPWLNSCLVLVDAFLRVLKNDMYIYILEGGGVGGQVCFHPSDLLQCNSYKPYSCQEHYQKVTKTVKGSMQKSFHM